MQSFSSGLGKLPCKLYEQMLIWTYLYDAEMLIIELPKTNQSVLCWYGQGDAGEGEDAVLPSMGILLVTTGTASHVSPTNDWSPKMRHFLPKIFFCT